ELTAELFQAHTELQGHHHPDADGGDHNQRQRAHTDLINLFSKQFPIKASAQLFKEIARKQTDSAHKAEDFQHKKRKRQADCIHYGALKSFLNFSKMDSSWLKREAVPP